MVGRAGGKLNLPCQAKPLALRADVDQARRHGHLRDGPERGGAVGGGAAGGALERGRARADEGGGALDGGLWREGDALLRLRRAGDEVASGVAHLARAADGDGHHRLRDVDAADALLEVDVREPGAGVRVRTREGEVGDIARGEPERRRLGADVVERRANGGRRRSEGLGGGGDGE